MKYKGYFIGAAVMLGLGFFLPEDIRHVWLVGGLVILWIGIGRVEEEK